MDFYKIKAKKFGNRAKQDYYVYPEFSYLTEDLVCKGGHMYAYWYEGFWRTNLLDLIRIIDKEVVEEYEAFKSKHSDREVSLKKMSDHDSSIMDRFLKFCKNMPDSDVEFNTRILFSNETPVREDYSTTQLSYTPTPGDTPAFDEMFNLLYDKEELDKILWFIGATLTNNMPKIQKFLFLYGGKGSGKGTIIKVFKMLFEGYYSGIDLHKLTSNSEFATSGVRETQLLIDDDSDLSTIRDDTNLLKLTSHEPIMVNNKYQSTYSVTFKGLLVAASNQRFKVRNIDSGITRRALVAEPTDLTHSYENYMTLMEKIQFELPQIANKAIETFESKGSGFYQDYVPFDMMESTDLFFSFMREHGRFLGDMCSLKTAAELYRSYLLDFDYDTSGYKKKAKNELKRYYKTFTEQKRIDGELVKNVYEGLKWKDIFPEDKEPEEPKVEDEESLMWYFNLKEQKSRFDSKCSTYPAQYAKEDGTPTSKWDNVSTVLKDIDTKKLHYVRVPQNHIVIDFDLKNSDGEKDLLPNLKAAKKFPTTYMELSKSGKGVHLHYIYTGDVGKLCGIYEEDIEIKVYKGKSSLRRKLSLCNDQEIAEISTGLPEKEESLDMYKDIEVIHWNEQKMRKAIKGNLDMKYHSNTRPSVDFIVKIFNDAEKDGVKYDLRDMRQDILSFAAKSTNQASYCISAVGKINYNTIEQDDSDDIQKKASKIMFDNKDLYFYDVEVFPNLFIVAFKKYGEDEVVKWINPSREQIASLVEKPLVGFNNRRYDNHIIYSALLGEDNITIYRQSQRIINDKNAASGMYSGAYEISYTDIYDYCNAGNKKSLKKWEVELGIKHDEFELPWDQPVPEDMWERAAEYCANDVIATEEVFKATQSDYNARRILATLSGLSVNSTTNQHTTSIIFEGKHRNDTKDDLVYTDLSKTFPGYKYEYGKSTYRGEEPGEGGYVYAEPGVYTQVALLDVVSMHPYSAINMNMFGKYTKNYKDILEARVMIKNGKYEEASKLFGGQLKPFLEDKSTAKDLSNALKTAINSVYGLTSAGFENQFKHPDNVDNIVAKRGALFMIDLKNAVQEKGYVVAHVKTDSIKIPNADQDIIDFVFKFGEKYGYEFEHEDTYRKLALVNKSTYVCEDENEEWHATGAQFQDPYVFKTLFSKQPIDEKDFFVTKEVKNASIYLGDTFIGRLAELYASKTGKEVFRVTEEKTGSISGTKNFKWRLSKDFQGKKDVDMAYYEGLVDKAIEAISKVGDVTKMVDRERIKNEKILEMDREDTKYLVDERTDKEKADYHQSMVIEKDELPF